jgi:hypothetical protein
VGVVKMKSLLSKLGVILGIIGLALFGYTEFLVSVEQAEAVA